MIAATLRELVETPLGAYGPGTPVYPLRVDGDTIRVCLDPTVRHLGRCCHTVTVSRSALHVTRSLP